MLGQTMTNKEYREHKGISRSELNIIRTKSPMHFKYAVENPEEEESSALLEGRAAHKMVLEPETFLDEFAISPKVDRRTAAGKEAYAAFIAENEGKDIITEEQMEKYKAMEAAIRQNPMAEKLLKGEHERSFFWTDAETGEVCKVRPDCLTEVDGKKYIVDYKTTSSCADYEFEKSVRKYGYKFQAGMYREGVFQNTFDEYGFAFVAQEKTAPYAVRVYFCDEEFIRQGYEQFKQALYTYHYCKEHDEWVGYGDDYLMGEEERS